MSDDRLKRALGTIGDAAGPPSPWETVVEARPVAAGPPERRFPVRRALAVAAGVVLVVGAVAVLSDDPDPRIAPSDTPTTDDTAVDSSGPVSVTTGWRRVDDLPVGRVDPLVESINGDLYVIGGLTTVCPPYAFCVQPPPDIVDGYRLDGDSWRPIADAPRPVADWVSVVVGEALYVVAPAADDTPNADSSPSLLEYRADTDSWREIELPISDTTGVRATALGDDMVIVPWEGSDPALLVDLPSGDVSELPADPLGALSDRWVVGDGDDLYLFGIEDPEVDVVVHGARLRDGAWQILDDVAVSTSGPWLATGGQLINPNLGCIGPQDDCVPKGGVFDTDTGSWSPLPDVAYQPGLAWGSAVVADGRSEIVGPTPPVAVLDPATGSWREVGLPDGATDDGAQRRIVAAGGGLAVVGGTRDRSDLGTDALPEVWIWTSTTVDDSSADPSSTAPDVEAAPTGWEKLPDSPLSPRYGSVVQRVGDEIIVVGGTNQLCPPGANCPLQPDEQFFADGAAYDLTTGRWRTIADAPGGTYSTSVVVLDGALYLADYDDDESTGEMTMDVWRYTPAEDRWDVIPAETVGALVAAGDTLAVSQWTDERGTGPDQILDRETGEWTDLPDDPLGPSFGRTMVGTDDALYVFARDNVANPGSGSTPSVARAARLDLATMTWTVLPDSEILTTGPWLVAGDLLVNPTLGCADGGGNSFGRCVPMGGIFDTSTDTWRDLPPIDGLGDEPYGEHGVVISASGAVLSAMKIAFERGFWVLDADQIGGGTDAWTKVTWPGDGQPGSLDVAGRDLVVAGGQQWDGDTGRLLDDIWIWRAP